MSANQIHQCNQVYHTITKWILSHKYRFTRHLKTDFTISLQKGKTQTLDQLQVLRQECLPLLPNSDSRYLFTMNQYGMTLSILRFYTGPNVEILSHRSYRVYISSTDLCVRILGSSQYHSRVFWRAIYLRLHLLIYTMETVVSRLRGRSN